MLVAWSSKGLELVVEKNVIRESSLTYTRSPVHEGLGLVVHEGLQKSLVNKSPI